MTKKLTTLRDWFALKFACGLKLARIQLNEWEPRYDTNGEIYMFLRKRP